MRKVVVVLDEEMAGIRDTKLSHVRTKLLMHLEMYHDKLVNQQCAAHSGSHQDDESSH